MNTTVLTNTPIKSQDTSKTGFITTEFEMTEKLSTFLIGISVFYDIDITSVASTTNSGIPVQIWARKNFIDEGQADMGLEMTVKIFDQLQAIFKNVDNSSLPKKIDIIAIPDYPVNLYLLNNSSNYKVCYYYN